MTKKELVKWLETKRAEAYNKVDDEGMKKQAEYESKKALELQIPEIAKLIFEDMKSLKEHYKMFTDNLGNKEKTGLSQRHWFNCISSFICSWDSLNQTLNNLERSYYDESKEKRKLICEIDEAKNSVDKEYKKVIANVKSMKDAKVATKYLTELGFDVPKDEKSEITALATPIDTKWLLLNIKD